MIYSSLDSMIALAEIPSRPVDFVLLERSLSPGLMDLGCEVKGLASVEPLRQIYLALLPALDQPYNFVDCALVDEPLKRGWGLQCYCTIILGDDGIMPNRGSPPPDIF